jgi:hypothetical protein
MNEKQKKTIAQVTKGKEAQFLQELMEHFLDRGLGSVSKSETDIFLFYLLDKYQKSQRLNLNNYEWSSLLKITERKIKNLRLEVGIRYTSDEDKDEGYNWLKVLELITEGYLEFEGAEKIILTIEDPYLKRFIEHHLKALKLPSADYTINPERVRLSVGSLEKLLAHGAELAGIGKGSSQAEEKLKKAKWAMYGKEGAKQLFGILSKALPGAMKEIKLPE